MCIAVVALCVETDAEKAERVSRTTVHNGEENDDAPRRNFE